MNFPLVFLLRLLSTAEWTILSATDFVSDFCSLFFYPNNILLLVLLGTTNCWLSSFAITSLALWRLIYLRALALSYVCYYCWLSLSSIKDDSYCSSFTKSEIVSCSTFYLFVRLRLPKALMSFLFYTLLHVCIVVMIFWFDCLLPNIDWLVCDFSILESLSSSLPAPFCSSKFFYFNKAGTLNSFIRSF